MTDETLTVRMGGAAYTPGGEIVFSHYVESGEDAIVITDATGRPQCKATVALWPPAPRAPDGYVWLKGWSENEGVPQALECAGIVQRLEIYHGAGYEVAQLARLTPLGLKLRAAQRTPDAAADKAAAWDRDGRATVNVPPVEAPAEGAAA